MESKPFYHLFGLKPDPSLRAKLMANSEEDQEIAVGESY
jgi:hypothetical protein